jgi:Zn-dependent protease
MGEAERTGLDPVTRGSGIRGALPLFRFFGIQVYLHFTWFLVAALEFQSFSRRYQAPIWGLIEYLALFAIVLTHEFGHALACRQTGGHADRIMLWPLGGVAFVSPPPRPGAYLWSIAAGPLVNVALVPVLTIVLAVSGSLHFRLTNPDAARFLLSVWWINLSLLIFNLLPIYPLDGGQLLRGVLWLRLGPVRSLKIASVVGFGGAIAFALIAFKAQSIWLGIMAFFLFSQAQRGWRAAQRLALEAESAGTAEPAPSPPPPPPLGQ